MHDDLKKLFETKFGDCPESPETISSPDWWQTLAGRASCRAFADERLEPALLDTLCALALCSATKSDLQQRDIIIVDDPALRGRLDSLLTSGRLGQAWIGSAPHLLVFCGNNRRHRLVHQWRDKPFVNDHLDAFFNAAVDAGIALATFTLAAEAAGLGCCPISAIRNEADQVSDLLGLPDHVFPVAGLAVGKPARPPYPSPRLPLSATVHRNRYTEDDLESVIDRFDARRIAVRPYSSQRYTDDFGEAADYGWSEDKARQYAKPERDRFGAFVKKKGFKLD